jgi:hypothetical protein
MKKLNQEQQYFVSILDTVLDGEGNKQEVKFCMDRIAHCNYCRSMFEAENAVRECIKKHHSYITPPQDLLLSIQMISKTQELMLT